MKKIIIAVITIACSLSLSANNVEISNVNMNGIVVTFDISWDNSWNLGAGDTWGDGVWIIVKQAPNGGPSWTQANVSSVTPGAGYEAIISDDNVGFTLKHTGSFNGTSSTSITANYSFPGSVYRDIKIVAVEMVKVPQGSFYLGDGWSDRTLHKGDDPTASYKVLYENGPIPIGTASDEIYGGNLLLSDTEIPTQFPKGYDPFYCMKYQITMEQYVDFLNCQPRAWQDNLTNASLADITISNYYVMTDSPTMVMDNVIRCDENVGPGNITFYCDRDNDGIPNEADDGQHRAINQLTIAQFLAYLDWVGLAPMTTLEYEKACRGTLPAVPGEFAWGSTIYNSGGNRINIGESDEKYTNSGTTQGIVLPGISANRSVRVGCNAPSVAGTRELSNGSHYGISGLSFFSNNVVKATTPYQGEHGDGTLLNGFQDSFGEITRLQSKSNPSATMPNTVITNRVSSYNGDNLASNIGVSGRGVRRL